MGHDAGAGLLTEAGAELVGVHDQDDYFLGKAEQGHAVVGGAGGFAGAVPSDHDALGRQFHGACLGDDQCGAAGVHEGGFDQKRLVGAARVRVGLADDHEVGVAGVAGEQCRQAVERAGFGSCFKRNTAMLGCFTRLGEDLFSLLLRLTQVLFQDVGRQVVAGHGAHERLGDQVKGRDMGAETLTQFKGGVEADRSRR